VFLGCGVNIFDQIGAAFLDSILVLVSRTGVSFNFITQSATDIKNNLLKLLGNRSRRII